MAEPATRAPTYADIEALPPNVVGEILGGELVVSPRPAPRHALAASKLGGILIPPFADGIGGPGGWWILHEPELALGVDEGFPVVVPDIAGWLQVSMPELPESAQFPTAPDWVCEVLSPSTANRDRSLKLPFYGRAGVRHVWLVDPLAQTVEVFAWEHGHCTLVTVAGGQDSVALAPFDAVDFALPRLWTGPA